MQAQLALDFPVTCENSYTIRISKRAKRLSIYLHNSGKVEVVAPQRASNKRIQAFIHDHRDWIEKHKSKLDLATQQRDHSTRPDSIKLEFLKRSWRIVYKPGAKEIAVHQDWIELPALNKDTENVNLLAAWLKQQAECHITPLMQSLSEQTGHVYRRLTFRGQKTRWGSCSPKGNINLNYCLLFLPENYVRYVLLHELCHLQELNHSPAFWNLVKSFESNYKRLDKKLNDYWVNLPHWLDLRFEKLTDEQEIVVMHV